MKSQIKDRNNVINKTKNSFYPEKIEKKDRLYMSLRFPFFALIKSPSCNKALSRAFRAQNIMFTALRWHDFC